MKELIDLLANLQDSFKVLLGFFFALLGFNIQLNWQERKQKQKSLVAFYNEVRINLVCCITMYKSEEFVQFDMDCLRLIKINDYIPFHKDIVMYKVFIEYANNAIIAYLEYKNRYTSDFNYRTPDNAGALDAKRTRLIQELKDTEKYIEKARDYLKDYLFKLKLIKKEKDKNE